MPNVATLVAVVVDEVILPVHPVPGADTVQVYESASPVLGGVATDGPPVGAKSAVIFTVIEPDPLVLDVRIRYVMLVVPVNGFANVVLAVDRFVVPVVTVRDASGPTATDNVVV